MMSSLNELLSSLYTVRQQKSALEKTEKAILTELKPIADPVFDSNPDEPIVGDGVQLTRSEGVSRTILGDLLLERGVSPEIIAYATKTTSYFQYRTKDVK